MSVQRGEVAAVVGTALAEVAQSGSGALIRSRVVIHLFRQLEQLRKIIGCRPEVIAFALHMERRLQEKDQDRVVSWKHKTPKAISIDLVSKAMRLDLDCVKMDKATLLKHAVDCGNFAMFIADVAGELSQADIDDARTLRQVLARAATGPA